MISQDRVVFTGSMEGDLRSDPDARQRLSLAVGVGPDWASVYQVHGSVVHRASAPGGQGDGDALWTDIPGLPLAIFTADCLGVALIADEAVGVAHAGWRGASAEVVPALAAQMDAAGHPPVSAVIGPGIGPCCFEVGPEVAELFPEHSGRTNWGTPSVDLVGVVSAQLDGVPVDAVRQCTHHQLSYFSHRRDGTKSRQAALVWL